MKDRTATPPPPLHADAPSSPGWPLSLQVSFRFVAAYLLLYNFPFPLSLIPWTERWALVLDKPWLLLARWVGKHVVHLEHELVYVWNGSGDTTYDYLRILCIAMTAVVVTIAWSLLERSRTDYSSLLEWLRIFVRWVLSCTMLGYGIIKIIKVQFPFPMVRMTETFGQMSPMGLLWSFMGYSTGYTFFGGALEALAGTLLLFRRTTSLGALVASGVLANVVALNIFYDVPVKLQSSHWLFMALFLVALDARRLVDVFILNRGCEPAKLQSPRFVHTWMSLAVIGIQFVVVGSVVISKIIDAVTEYRAGDGGAKSGIYGIYEVETFSRDGITVPPLLTEPTRWRWIAQNGRVLAVTLVDGSIERYRVEHDEANHTFRLYSRILPPAAKHVLSYVKSDDGLLTFQGTVNGEVVIAVVRKVDESRFLLMSRGFHWINEAPFNK